MWCNKVPTIFTTSNIHQAAMWTPVITVKKDKWWSQILRRSILEFYLAQSGNFNESIAFCFAQTGTFNHKSIVFYWAQTETLTNQSHFILDKRNRKRILLFEIVFKQPINYFNIWYFSRNKLSFCDDDFVKFETRFICAEYSGLFISFVVFLYYLPYYLACM